MFGTLHQLALAGSGGQPPKIAVAKNPLNANLTSKARNLNVLARIPSKVFAIGIGLRILSKFSSKPLQPVSTRAVNIVDKHQHGGGKEDEKICTSQQFLSL